MLAMVLFGVLLFGGIIMLVIGVRGRRLDDHPLCRKCRYDLSGLGDGPVQSCPECGVDVSTRRARRIGNRRRRVKVLIGGVLLTLIGFGGGGTIVGLQAKQFDWNSVKPVWWLRLDSESSVLAEADNAWKILESRLLKDELSAGQVEGLIEFVLARQTDTNRPWPPFAGSFIEKARLKDLVLDETFYEYLREGMTSTFVLSVNEKVRPDVPLWLHLNNGPMKYSDNAFMTLKDQSSGKYYNYSMTFILGGNASMGVREHLGSIGIALRPGGGSMNSSLCRTPKETGWASVTLGLEWQLRYTTRDVLSGPEENWPPPLLVWKDDLTTFFDVVGYDVPIVTMIEDPQLEPAIRVAIKIQIPNDSYYDEEGNLMHSPVGLEVRLESIPIALAFDIYGSDGQQTVKLGSFSAPNGGFGGHLVDHRNMELFFDRETIDVILRSSEKVAEKNITFGEFWSGEIIFENVRIHPEAQEEK